jgi:hypothetical protein
LRVELKKVPLGTLKHEFRESAPENLLQGTRLEFNDPVLRIERVVCDAGATCELPAHNSPSVLVEFSPTVLLQHGRPHPFPEDSATLWLRAGQAASIRGATSAPAHLLRIVLLDR